MSPDAVFDKARRIPIRGGIRSHLLAHGTRTLATRANQTTGSRAPLTGRLFPDTPKSCFASSIRMASSPANSDKRKPSSPTRSPSNSLPKIRGKNPLLGGALHSYFHVGDTRTSEITGPCEKKRPSPLNISPHLPRRHRRGNRHDTSLARKIHITRREPTAVIWNPWKEIAADHARLPSKRVSRNGLSKPSTPAKILGSFSRSPFFYPWLPHSGDDDPRRQFSSDT